MTDKEIVFSAIKKAQSNGWNTELYIESLDLNKSYNFVLGKEEYEIEIKVDNETYVSCDLDALLFDRGFVEAFFRYYDWSREIQLLAITDFRIQYLKKWL